MVDARRTNFASCRAVRRRPETISQPQDAELTVSPFGVNARDIGSNPVAHFTCVGLDQWQIAGTKI
jgi:hypothetical protein